MVKNTKPSHRSLTPVQGSAAHSGPHFRAVEVQEHERPLYRVYRPAPSAHSSHLLVQPSTSNSPFALPLSTSQSARQYRKQHGAANDAAALDRLLAPAFSSEAKTGGLDELGMVGKPRERRSLDRHESMKSAESRHSGEGTNLSGDSKRKSKSHRRSRLSRRQSHGSSSSSQEELTSRGMNLYVDKDNKLHDGDFDPFETVRSKSLKKVQHRPAFGADVDPEQGSEVGSLGGSSVGFNNAAAAWTGGGGAAYRADEEERIRRRLVEERRRLQVDVDAAKGYDDGRFHHQYVTEDGKETASEYDSGYAATSPGPSKAPSNGVGGVVEQSIGALSPPVTSASQYVTHHPLNHDTLSPELSTSYASNNAPRSSGLQSASQYKEYPRHLPTSMTSGRGYLVDREEHARQLLFPDTPPPPRESASTFRHSNSATAPGATTSRIASFDPPVAPFATDASGNRPKARRTDSIGSNDMFRKHTAPSAVASKPGSTVFDPQEYGYLPSRWAQGDHELRLGEEAREKYRPREWHPTHSANEKQKGDFIPSCTDSIKHNWHEFCLSLRFSTHRTKKKLERKMHI